MREGEGRKKEGKKRKDEIKKIKKEEGGKKRKEIKETKNEEKARIRQFRMRRNKTGLSAHTHTCARSMTGFTLTKKGSDHKADQNNAV